MKPTWKILFSYLASWLPRGMDQFLGNPRSLSKNPLHSCGGWSVKATPPLVVDLKCSGGGQVGHKGCRTRWLRWKSWPWWLIVQDDWGGQGVWPSAVHCGWLSGYGGGGEEGKERVIDNELSNWVWTGGHFGRGSTYPQSSSIPVTRVSIAGG